MKGKLLRLKEAVLGQAVGPLVIRRNFPEEKVMKIRSLVMFMFMVLLGSSSLSCWAAELNWTGCGITKKAFMKELAAAYEKKTGTVIKITGGGATKGIRAASAGTTDLGGSCRHWLREVDGGIHAQEKDAELVQVAWDALVLIVNPENTVDSISLDQVRKVYDGKITNWSELGGDDSPIGVVARKSKTSGVGLMFRVLAFGNPDYDIGARALLVKSTGPLEKKVEKVKTAIAIDGVSSARKRDVRFLKLDGISPTRENIAAGKYTLFRPLYLTINRNNSSKQARAFVEFALSQEGQAIISGQGTVNLAEGKALNALWDAKMADSGALRIAKSTR